MSLLADDTHRVTLTLEVYGAYRGIPIYSADLADRNTIYGVELGMGNWQYRTDILEIGDLIDKHLSRGP